MPWKESTTMSERREFVFQHSHQALPFAELCRRFGISRKTGYKWLARGEELADRSRRPINSPSRTSEDLEARVVALRQRHPAWGGRKIAQRLIDLGVDDVPAPSTVTHVLRRHGLIETRPAGQGRPYQRFEHPHPNALWQMDFKGDFALSSGRCYPLTVLDDHARYNVVLTACSGQNFQQVQPVLIRAFERYGLPERINTDHGQPWGSPSAKPRGLSLLSIWLIRLGIRISFSAPAHPQTNGKDERFHRSLKAEVLAGQHFVDLIHAQRAFDRWRSIYNHERPHDALGLKVPATRYRPSPRAYPTVLPPIEYAPNDQVAVIGWNGELRFAGRRWRVPSSLKDQPIALRQTSYTDECFDLYFCHHRFARLDLRNQTLSP